MTTQPGLALRESGPSPVLRGPGRSGTTRIRRRRSTLAQLSQLLLKFDLQTRLYFHFFFSVMTTPFPPTQGENALVNQIFNKHDPQKFGVITSEVAIDAFSRANLHPTVLGQIWGIADTDKQGFLTRKGVSIAVRLIGWAQKGEVITGDLANKRERDPPFSPKSVPLISSKAGPLAVFDGVSLSSEPRRAVSPPPTSSRLPPLLSPQDKTKFTRLFNSCGPINGLLSGMYMVDSSQLVYNSGLNLFPKVRKRARYLSNPNFHLRNSLKYGTSHLHFLKRSS